MTNRNLTHKIEVSERSNGDLDLSICLCDFETNANGKKLNIDSIDNYKSTLIDTPLQARIAKIANTDEEDFTSHNRKVNYVLKEGNLTTETILDTDSIGVFKDIEVSYIEDKPYMFAKALMWGSRYKNAKKIILERANSEQGLYGSWEFVITDSTKALENGNNIELINNGYFIGFALLGRNPITGNIINPAYSCAKVLEVAEEERDELQEAIQEDIRSIQSEKSVEDKLIKKGGNEMEDKDIVEEIVKEEVSEVEKKIEVSALTISDIKRAIWDLEYEASKSEDYWLYDSIIYPLENTVYFSKRGNDCIEEDWLKIAYSIGEDGKANIISKEDVKMVFVPKDTTISLSEFEKVQAEVSEKVESIVKLGETLKSKEEIIAQKDIEISEMQTFKAQVEEIQAEQARQEIAEKQNKLKNIALSSKYVTEKDLDENEELKIAISELDEKAVMLHIASQVLKQIPTNNEKDIEVSEEKKDVEISTDLNATETYMYKGETGNALLDLLQKNKKKRF